MGKWQLREEQVAQERSPRISKGSKGSLSIGTLIDHFMYMSYFLFFFLQSYSI